MTPLPPFKSGVVVWLPLSPTLEVAVYVTGEDLKL